MIFHFLRSEISFQQFLSKGQKISWASPKKAAAVLWSKKQDFFQSLRTGTFDDTTRLVFPIGDCPSPRVLIRDDRVCKHCGWLLGFPSSVSRPPPYLLIQGANTWLLRLGKDDATFRSEILSRIEDPILLLDWTHLEALADQWQVLYLSPASQSSHSWTSLPPAD